MKALRLRALTAFWLAAAGSLWAAPTEIPPIDAKVGSGESAASRASAAPAVPSLDLAVPSLNPLLPFQAVPSVLPDAAPLAAAQPAAPQAAAAPQVGSQAFQRSLEGVAAETNRVQDNPGGEQAGVVGAALFDLSAQPSAAAAVYPDLPANEVGKTLARLRRAGESGAGPGAVPGLSRVQWAGPTGHGNSGETTKVVIDGQMWYMKRLGHSPDEEIANTPAETRAANEEGFAGVLREDPLLSRSFSVPAKVIVFRDGAKIFVLSRGLPATGDGESRRQELTAVQRADAAIIQLVLGMGDMHGGDVLPLRGGGFGLVDFEKLSRAPLEPTPKQKIDEQVMMKNFPLVDRLSRNDPAVYRARFTAWKKDYDSGGRARMDRALAQAGWSRGSRAAYLSAVDRNAETYSERLQPYLDYGNDWFKRITEARAEQARRDAAPKKGFFKSLFGGDQ